MPDDKDVVPARLLFDVGALPDVTFHHDDLPVVMVKCCRLN